MLIEDYLKTLSKSSLIELRDRIHYLAKEKKEEWVPISNDKIRLTFTREGSTDQIRTISPKFLGDLGILYDDDGKELLYRETLILKEYDD